MSFVNAFFSDKSIEKYTDDSKQLYGFCDANGIDLENIKLDTSLAAYLLNPNSSDYSVRMLAGSYSLAPVKIDAVDLSDFYLAEKDYVDGAAYMEAFKC